MEYNNFEAKPFYKTAPFLSRIQQEKNEYKVNPMQSDNCCREIISDGYIEDKFYIEFNIKPMEGN